MDQSAGDQSLQSPSPSNSPVPAPAVFTSASAPAPTSCPEADGKLVAPEENGEAEVEPMGNGAGHISETESSDSGATPGEKENSAGAPQDIEGKKTLHSWHRLSHKIQLNSTGVQNDELNEASRFSVTLNWSSYVL